MDESSEIQLERSLVNHDQEPGRLSLDLPLSGRDVRARLRIADGPGYLFLSCNENACTGK